ncbi:MAG: lysophospholipase [Bacteroidales bacterium]|nr:lysophospholipase [Bacteroidales bacterium]
MNNQTYTWTAKDGRKIFAQSWKAEQDEKKLIMLVHGLGEHCSRYEHWAEFFNRKGYSMIALDLHGHGKSEGKRGHVKSLDVLLDDIDLLYDKSSEIFPDYSKILYGHSMGGTLVLNHVIRRNRPLKALIVTSPWLKLYNEPSEFLLKLTGFLKKVFPSLSISNQLKAEQISHDPEIVRDYERDPLNHDRISLKMFHEIYQAGYHALRNVYKINCPFLIMHGTADTICSPKASQDYVLNTSKRTHLKMWENQYHELHNEFIKEDVHAYIVDWLVKNKI